MPDLMMTSLVVALAVGIGLGYLLRGRKHLNFDKVTSVAIVVLIFSMGFSIGSDNELLESMPKIGGQATVIMLLAVFFSVVFLKAARKLVKLE